MSSCRARLAASLTASSLGELHDAEVELLGKRSEISLANRRLGSLDPEARREAGRALGEARAQIEGAITERRTVLQEDERRARLASDRLDLTEIVDPAGTGLGSIGLMGHLHVVQRTRDELEDVFLGMGFTIAEGPEVETDWYNFEALNIPPAHPARGMWDTFYLDMGEPGTVLLRTHTSPVQIRLMQEHQPPIYSVMPGRCYRRDTPTPATIRSSIRSKVSWSTARSVSPISQAPSKRSQRLLRSRNPLAVAARILPFHRAVRGVRDHLHDLQGRRLPDLLADRLDRARWLRDGRSRSLRSGRCRPREMDGFRVRFRDRPLRADASRDRRHACHARKRRPSPHPGLGVVSMRVPVSWLRDFAPFGPADTLIPVADDLGLVVEGVEQVGEGLEDVVVARVREIAAIPGADRIRRVVVDAGGGDLEIVLWRVELLRGRSRARSPLSGRCCREEWRLVGARCAASPQRGCCARAGSLVSQTTAPVSSFSVARQLTRRREHRSPRRWESNATPCWTSQSRRTVPMRCAWPVSPATWPRGSGSGSPSRTRLRVPHQ